MFLQQTPLLLLSQRKEFFSAFGRDVIGVWWPPQRWSRTPLHRRPCPKSCCCCCYYCCHGGCWSGCYSPTTTKWMRRRKTPRSGVCEAFCYVSIRRALLRLGREERFRCRLRLLLFSGLITPFTRCHIQVVRHGARFVCCGELIGATALAICRLLDDTEMLQTGFGWSH